MSSTEESETMSDAPEADYPSPPQVRQDLFRYKGFTTLFPTKRPRYNRNIDIYAARDGEEEINFKSLESRNAFQQSGVEHWRRHVQAEGQPYYYLPRDRLRRFSYLVELDLTDKDVLEEVECFIVWFEVEADELYESDSPNEDIEVVIETGVKDPDYDVNAPHDGFYVHAFKGLLWAYYMVDVKERKIFWIHDFIIPKEKMSAVIGKREHLHHIFGSEYWTHVKDFPNHHSVAPDTVDKVLGILSCYFIDDTLENGDGQITPFYAQDLRECIRTIENLYAVQKQNSGKKGKGALRNRPGYLMYCIARVMISVETERFRNFHGFHGARLDAHQSVRGEKPEPRRTWLAKLMLPFLFYQPSNNLRRFEKMYTDHLICLHDWMEWQERLERNSNTFIIFATVLLAVDISFLAVPSVIGDRTQDPLPANLTSLTTLTAQISMITSVGSIIIGLLHGQQERIDTKDKANTYTSDSKPLQYLNGDLQCCPKHDLGSQFRLETLAMQYSLPFGLLEWGIAFFVVSVLTSCFDANFTIVGVTARRWIYGSVCVIVVISFLWTIHVGAKMNAGPLKYEKFVCRLLTKLQQ